MGSGVFFVQKMKRGELFVKKVDLTPQNETESNFVFFILHFTYWGEGAVA